MLHTADLCTCSVTMAPSSDKQFSTGLELYAAWTSHMSEATGSYFETLVYHDL